MVDTTSRALAASRDPLGPLTASRFSANRAMNGQTSFRSPTAGPRLAARLLLASLPGRFPYRPGSFQRVPNDEPALLQLLAGVLELANGDEVVWVRAT